MIYFEKPDLFKLNLELDHHLHKVLYSLKQRSKILYLIIFCFLIKLGFEYLKQDYIMSVSLNSQIFLALYSNDLFFYIFDKFHFKKKSLLTGCVVQNNSLQKNISLSW